MSGLDGRCCCGGGGGGWRAVGRSGAERGSGRCTMEEEEDGGDSWGDRAVCEARRAGSRGKQQV